MDYLESDERDHLNFVLMYIPQFLIRVRFTRSDQVEEQCVLLTEKHRKNLGELMGEIEKRYKLKSGELRFVPSSELESAGNVDGLCKEWLMNLWRKKEYVLDFETDKEVEDKKCYIM